MKSILDIPQIILKREHVYRALPTKANSFMIGCGTVTHQCSHEATINRPYPVYGGVYLLRGNGKYIDSSGKKYPLSAGDFFQRIPGRQHSTIPGNDGQWFEFFMSLPSELYHELASMGVLSDDPVLHPGIDRITFQKCLSILEKMRHCDINELYQVLIDMQQLIIDICKLASKNDLTDSNQAIVAAVIESLKQTCCNPNCLEELADSTPFNYNTLRRVFRDKTGITLGQFRNNLRFDQAKSLLSTTTISLSDIARMIGYSDAYAFSKQFKQSTGVSPGAFRNRFVIHSTGEKS